MNNIIGRVLDPQLKPLMLGCYWFPLNDGETTFIVCAVCKNVVCCIFVLYVSAVCCMLVLHLGVYI